MKRFVLLVFGLLMAQSMFAQDSIFGFYWYSPYEMVCRHIEEMIAPDKLEDVKVLENDSILIIQHTLLPENKNTPLLWIFTFDVDYFKKLKSFKASYIFEDGTKEEYRDMFVLALTYYLFNDEYGLGFRGPFDKSYGGKKYQLYIGGLCTFRYNEEKLIVEFIEPTPYSAKDWYDLGEVIEKSGLIKEAMWYFSMSLKKGNKHAAFKQAYYWCSGDLGYIDYKKAVEVLEAVIPFPNSNGNEYWLLGECYKNGGNGIVKDLEKAKSYYQNGVSKNNTPCCNALAYLYLSQGQYAQALETINKAITIAPDNYNYYDTKGEIYLRKGDVDNALIMWNKAASLASDDLGKLKEMSDLYKGLKLKGLVK